VKSVQLYILVFFILFGLNFGSHAQNPNYTVSNIAFTWEDFQELPLLDSVIVFYDSALNTYDRTKKYEFDYNPQGNIVKIQAYNTRYSPWNKIFECNFTYEDNKLTSFTDENIASRFEYSYNEDGFVSEVFDIYTFTERLQGKMEYSYDANGNLILEKEFVYFYQDTIIHARAFEYDEFNRVQRERTARNLPYTTIANVDYVEDEDTSFTWQELYLDMDQRIISDFRYNASSEIEYMIKKSYDSWGGLQSSTYIQQEAPEVYDTTKQEKAWYYYRKDPKVVQTEFLDMQELVVEYNYGLDTSVVIEDYIFSNFTHRDDIADLYIEDVYILESNTKELHILLSRPFDFGDSFEILSAPYIPLQDGRIASLEIVAKTTTVDISSLENSIEIRRNAHGLKIHAAETIEYIRAFDMQGRLLSSQQPNSLNTQCSFENQAVYILQVQTQHSQKIIQVIP
jgi:hypothetical protein